MSTASLHERIPAAGVESHDVADGQLHPLRHQDVTASVIGALFDLHPYVTLAELHAEKSGIDMPTREASSVIRRGRALESVVAAEVGREHPEWKITKASEYLRDPTLRIGATPDFYVEIAGRGRGILQTKTVASSVFRKTWTETSPPFWISLQAATEMMLTGADFGIIAALVIGDFTFDLHLYDVPRHPASERRIRETVATFWQHVESGEQPKIDYVRDGPLLAVLFPRETKGKIIDLRTDNRIVELLDEHDRLSDSVGHLKDALESCNNEIKAKLEDAEAALVPLGRISFKEQHRKEYTVKATSYRVLRIAREKSAAA